MPLRLDGVAKRYATRLPWVVRDVTMEIRPGALVRLEGRNGTGKSTLLRVIAGASTPSRGTVTGRPVTGYVPERFPAALPFTARDYIGHVGRVHGMSATEVAERTQACLDRLGGWEFADVPLRNMSKGMCQKVAIAQALLPPSGLLVLDEAWTGLDVEARAALDEVIGERLAAGGSVVFVDHDPQRLNTMDAERWRIEHGQIRRARGDGTPDGGSDAASIPQQIAEPVGESAEEPGKEPTADSGGDGEAGGDAEAGEGAMVIEVAGYPSGAADPERLAGVMAATRQGDRLVVRTDPAVSDTVLRTLLGAGEGVHVVKVAPGSGESGARQ